MRRSTRVLLLAEFGLKICAWLKVTWRSPGGD